MQGFELKAIRESLGMTQAQFADVLDISRAFVSLMERGENAVERRTELAAKYLELVKNDRQFDSDRPTKEIAMNNGSRKTRATFAKDVVPGRHYTMWLDKDNPRKAPHKNMPVEIMGWQKRKNPGVFVPGPEKMKGMDPDFILLVKSLTTGEILTVTDAPDNGGAVWWNGQRATFHAIKEAFAF